MAWIEGNQLALPKENVNAELMKIEGFLSEEEAMYQMARFLRDDLYFTSQFFLGLSLYPFQAIAIKAMMKSDYFLAVWGRGMSKTMTAAVYCIFEALFNPGIQIGVVSKTYRQAKMILQKIQEIISKPGAKIFESCIGRIKEGNDVCYIEIGKSRIVILPTGDGEKLRGFRFQRLVVDEFLLMPEKIFTEVLMPMLAVVTNPTERDDVEFAETELIEAGVMKEEERTIWPNNKVILLSSASYKFDYLYKVYKKYEQNILEANPKKKGVARNAIMHFCHTCAPDKLYDKNNVEQAKSTLSHAQFQREYEAVFSDDSGSYFKITKMNECSYPDGEGIAVKVVGSPDESYILSLDPAWSESDSSDDFAMHLIKLHPENNTGTVCHSYAVPGLSMKKHIAYFHYLLTSFNIVAIVADFMGGVQFVSAANESELFKKSKINIKSIDVDIENQEDYKDSLRAYMGQYNLAEKRICFFRKPSTNWIRSANEMLQSQFDHKRLWFASRALNIDAFNGLEDKIKIDTLTFMRGEGENEKNLRAKMLDLVDVIYDNILMTKNQCASIEVTTNPQGSQSFDLPPNLKRQTGPSKARKDSYSALVLGNWMMRVWFDATNQPKDETLNTFTPILI